MTKTRAKRPTAIRGSSHFVSDPGVTQGGHLHLPSRRKARLRFESRGKSRTWGKSASEKPRINDHGFRIRAVERAWRRNRISRIHTSRLNAQRRLNIGRRILPHLNLLRISTKGGRSLTGRHRDILRHFSLTGEEDETIQKRPAACAQQDE